MVLPPLIPPNSMTIIYYSTQQKRALMLTCFLLTSAMGRWSRTRLAWGLFYFYLGCNFIVSFPLVKKISSLSGFIQLGLIWLCLTLFPCIWFFSRKQITMEPALEPRTGLLLFFVLFLFSCHCWIKYKTILILPISTQTLAYWLTLTSRLTVTVMTGRFHGSLWQMNAHNATR